MARRGEEPWSSRSTEQLLPNPDEMKVAGFMASDPACKEILDSSAVIVSEQDVRRAVGKAVHTMKARPPRSEAHAQNICRRAVRWARSDALAREGRRCGILTGHKNTNLPNSEPPPTPEELLLTQEERELAANVWNWAIDHQDEAIYDAALLHTEGHSFVEIAAIQGCNPDTASRRYKEGLRKLRCRVVLTWQ